MDKISDSFSPKAKAWRKRNEALLLKFLKENDAKPTDSSNKAGGRKS
jgi:hypothetical protein